MLRISVSGSSTAGRTDHAGGRDSDSGSTAAPRPGPVRWPADLAVAIRSGLDQVLARADVTWVQIRSAYAQLAAEPDEPPANWMGHCLTRVGNLLFAGKDQEAGWHAWSVERRGAGLGRAYRDPRFDTLASCPRGHRVSTVADGTACQQCSAAERLVRA
jgi:hypothetical protein